MWGTRIGGHFEAMKKCDISVTQSLCDNGLLWLKDYTKTVKCGAEIGQRIVLCSVLIRPLVSRAPSTPRREMEPSGSHQSLGASSTCLKNDTGIPSHLFKERGTDRCQWPRPHPLFLNSRALHSQSWRSSGHLMPLTPNLGPQTSGHQRKGYWGPQGCPGISGCLKKLYCRWRWNRNPPKNWQIPLPSAWIYRLGVRLSRLISRLPNWEMSGINWK